jgi:hypothetical protein
MHNVLSRVSTATLTTQLFKRGFRNVFMQGVSAAPRRVIDPGCFQLFTFSGVICASVEKRE